MLRIAGSLMWSIARSHFPRYSTTHLGFVHWCPCSSRLENLLEKEACGLAWLSGFLLYITLSWFMQMRHTVDEPLFVFAILIGSRVGRLLYALFYSLWVDGSRALRR